jgi:hypothetical protein
MPAPFAHQPLINHRDETDLAVVFSLFERATNARYARRERLLRLDGLSGQQALELFIAAYVADPQRSESILRAMSNQQIEDALLLLHWNRARSTPRR